MEFQSVLLSLLKHESAEAEPDKSLLSEVARGSFLCPQEKVEPVFKCVFCPASHELGDFRPLLRTLKFQDILQQSAVLLRRPGSLMDVRVEEAVPMFPALLWCPKNFIPGGVSLI